MRVVRIQPVVVAALLVHPIASADAHEVTWHLTQDRAVVVQVQEEDGTPFDRQPYAVYRPDVTDPYQSGTTDMFGRLAFVPDLDGPWRIRVASPDGHGIDVTLDLENGVVRPDDLGASRRGLGRWLLALGTLFGLFGLTALWIGRRPRPTG